jgi:transcriptional regulator with XRE-family HTH domain
MGAAAKTKKPRETKPRGRTPAAEAGASAAPASAASEPADAADTAVRSEGQRLLRLVPGSLREIAARVNVKSRQTVLDWRDGRKVPGPGMRAALADAYGIPVPAWSQLPSRPSSSQASGTPAPRSPTPPVATAPVRTLEHCLALIADVQKERKVDGLVPAERIKLADAEGRLLSLRHRLEKEHDLLESRIVNEHPSWVRLRRTLVAALAKHPAAARDVMAAIEQLEGEG